MEQSALMKPIYIARDIEDSSTINFLDTLSGKISDNFMYISGTGG